jgi:murein DD-endopeptidase MepM/ murein hydrolase activator NlpD
MGARMARGGRINLLIVFDQSEKSHQWSLSVFSLKIVIGAAALSVLMSIAAVILVWQVTVQRRTVAELAAENKRLNVISLETSQLKEELAHYRNFSRRLCEMVGVEFPDSAAPVFGSPGRLTEPLEYPDSVDTISDGDASTLGFVSEAPLPNQLLPHEQNQPVGVPMRGQGSRGFNPDADNLALRHYGLDIAGREGSPVFATAAGVVEFAGWDEALGNLIILNHENGFKTIYGHNSVMMIKQGDKIQFGDIICLSGNSGISSAPHLHYEIRYNDHPLDPLSFILADESLLIREDDLP